MDFKEYMNSRKASTTGWIPSRDARPDGTICNIRCGDSLGVYDCPGEHFLHNDGFWYRIDPPTKVAARVHSFKPVAAEKMVERLHIVKPANKTVNKTVQVTRRYK